MGKEEINVDHTEVHENDFANLESLFSRPLFSKPFTAVTDDQDIVELNIGPIFFASIISLMPHTSSSF